MQLALVAVVLSVAPTHRLIGLKMAAEGAHAFSRHAVRRLDAGAAIAAGHLRAGVLESCKQGNTIKGNVVKSFCLFFFFFFAALKSTSVEQQWKSAERSLYTGVHYE